MSNKTPTLFEAEREFKAKAEVLNKYLLQEKLTKTALQLDGVLTSEMYNALEARFAKDLAQRRMEECVANQSKYLDIGNCDLNDDDFADGKILDKLLQQCTHIETLILSNAWRKLDDPNEITSINKGKSNIFSKIPNAINFCKHLKVLICSGRIDSQNKQWTIEDLSPVSHLSDLTYLDFSINQIKEIKGLETFSSLQSLILYGNQIKEITGLDSLIALENLHLSDNPINEMKGLSYLCSLKILILGATNITEIKGLEALTGLEELHLWQTKITEIKGLKALTSLTTLNVMFSQIKELGGLDGLHNLRTLDLSKNHITQIKEMESLDSLTSVSLRSNNISKLNGLSSFKALQWLDLSYNRITELKGLQTLTSLTYLHLSSNQIREVKELKSLSKLSYLDVSFNQIGDIKDFEFLLNKKGKIDVRLDNNPFVLRYNLILEWGKNHFRFLKELLLREKSTNKQILTYPVKVLLLGNHAAGKSTLVNYFFDAKSEGSTHILRIISYWLPSSVGKVYIPDVFFYDFGGQDFYHGLYQAFISPGSLQIIVFDTNSDNNLPSADANGQPIFNYHRRYWLGQKRYIEAKNSYNTLEAVKTDPYIVVQTHADNPKVSEVDTLDYSEFDGFKKSFFLSLAKTENDTLKNHENYLKAGRDYFFAHFIYEIEKLLAENTKEEADWYVKFYHFIVYKQRKTDRYRKGSYKHTTLKSILNDYGTEEMSKVEKLDSLQTNLKILHNHGLVLYYLHEDLKDVVWLNPDILVDYVQSYILSKNIITAGHSGIVDKQSFENLADLRIRQLLLLQKVVFLHQPEKDKPEKDKYIIPNYLPLVNTNEPDYQLYTFGLGKPNFIIKFGDFIPFGFINQMVCFYGEQPDAKKFWRNQLLFTLHGEARILIHLDNEELKIKVYLQLLENGGNNELQIAEYLFFSIMALYWNIDNENMLSYSEFIEFEERKIKTDDYQDAITSKENPKYTIWNNLKVENKMFPSDAYISIDDKRYVSYKELFALHEDNYRIASFGIKDGFINKADVKEITTSQFSFIKKTATMKNVFISYSHNDIQYRQSLQQFLVNLERDGLIDVWQDGLIQTGEFWDKKIKSSLQKADICIMLLSQEFIASNYVHQTEFKTIMEKRKNENCKIIPVLIKNCDWKNWKVYPQEVLDKLNEKDRIDYAIENFQFLPHDENNRLLPINKFNQPEEAWLQVIDVIKSFCKTV